MPGRNFLFVPGPTNVPDRILRAMHLAMEDHRSPSFPALTKPLFSDLKKIFKTESGECVIFTGSGTGGWEAALSGTNLLNKYYYLNTFDITPQSGIATATPAPPRMWLVSVKHKF